MYFFNLTSMQDSEMICGHIHFYAEPQWPPAREVPCKQRAKNASCRLLPLAPPRTPALALPRPFRRTRPLRGCSVGPWPCHPRRGPVAGQGHLPLLSRQPAAMASCSCLLSWILERRTQECPGSALTHPTFSSMPMTWPSQSPTACQ